MVELQSCAGLVQESRGESLDVIAQMSDELQRERQRNAELMERISILEAKLLQQRVQDAQLADEQAMHRSFKRLQKSKEERDAYPENLVNWMSMDETQLLYYEKLKECDVTVNSIDTDDTDDEDDHCKEAKESESKSVVQEKGENNETGNFEMYNGKPNVLTSFQRKPPKLGFCPKEVKGIVKSEVLMKRNAQSHTMRKIIVFACLGIRHGCEEMYELDFNHFSIIRKGEPYISPQNPGEQVLYENPGVRRKMFYPDRQNPTLCPVQILEEEKAMRPLEANCPSCLFLCIKYGGRTRNLPQNEYVRQRMGRNKLKSFGPLMCRMALLANIRSGSFFFKALGITLLFMAGFPDDLVRKETKYRNLDLLQKYYRTDKDAEGEELFLANLTTGDIEDKSILELSSGRSISTKSKRKKQSSTNEQPVSSHMSALQQSSSTSQFGYVGYTSTQTRAAAAFQSLPSSSETPVDQNHPIPSLVAAGSSAVASYQNQNPFNYFPSNAFVPMFYWPPNSFSPGLYPSAYNYHSFPSSGNYISFQSRPYYSYPCSPFIPKPVEEIAQKEDISEETDSDSDSSSSSKDQNI